MTFKAGFRTVTAINECDGCVIVEFFFENDMWADLAFRNAMNLTSVCIAFY